MGRAACLQHPLAGKQFVGVGHQHQDVEGEGDEEEKVPDILLLLHIGLGLCHLHLLDQKIRNARKKLSFLNLVDETAEEEDGDGQQLVVVGNEVGEDEDEEETLPGVLLSIGQRCLRHLQN